MSWCTPESIRDKIYKILAYYINHIGINILAILLSCSTFFDIISIQHAPMAIHLILILLHANWDNIYSVMLKSDSYVLALKGAPFHER